jgi:hypothetical protein
VLAGKVASDKTLIVQIRQLFSVLILCNTQQPLVPNTVVDVAQGTDVKGEDVVIVFERVDLALNLGVGKLGLGLTDDFLAEPVVELPGVATSGIGGGLLDDNLNKSILY